VRGTNKEKKEEKKEEKKKYIRGQYQQ